MPQQNQGAIASPTLSASMTKGGLAPATITNLDNNDVVNFMFNPFEYTLTKGVTWQTGNGAGRNAPPIYFEQGKAITLKLTMHFDSQVSGTDVRTYTEKLWKMVLIDTSTIDPKTSKGQPPPVVFDWGKLHFKAVITNLSQQFTLFNETGLPLRCKVDIDLQEYANNANEMGQAQAGGTTPARASVPAVQGQRLDNMTDDPNDQRSVAERNNINDPLNIPRGTQMNMDKSNAR